MRHKRTTKFKSESSLLKKMKGSIKVDKGILKCPHKVTYKHRIRTTSTVFDNDLDIYVLFTCIPKPMESNGFIIVFPEHSPVIFIIFDLKCLGSDAGTYSGKL